MCPVAFETFDYYKLYGTRYKKYSLSHEVEIIERSKNAEIMQLNMQMSNADRVFFKRSIYGTRYSYGTH